GAGRLPPRAPRVTRRSDGRAALRVETASSRRSRSRQRNEHSLGQRGSMLKDLRHGFRTLFQAKGWTAVVVLSLALGIGANTVLFSAVNGLLLPEFTVADPDSL